MKLERPVKYLVFHLLKISITNITDTDSNSSCAEISAGDGISLIWWKCSRNPLPSKQYLCWCLLGLIGAMFSELLINWTIYANKLAAFFTILFIIVIDLAIGLLPWVDNFGHIGGLLTGFIHGFVLLIRPQFGWEEFHNSSQYGVRARSKYNPCQYVLFFIAGVFVVAGLTVGTVMLFEGENGNKLCKWCHRLDCYPTSKWSC